MINQALRTNKETRRQRERERERERERGKCEKSNHSQASILFQTTAWAADGTNVMSAQLDHPCAVASQSYRNPKTYLPAGKSGTLTTSRTAGCCAMIFWSYGTGNDDAPQGWRTV